MMCGPLTTHWLSVLRHSTAAAYGVSGATLAAGVAKSMRGVLHAYRWVDDAMSDVVGSPSSLSTSSAYGVDDRGQIVGERERPRVPLPERRNTGSWNVARRQGEPGAWHQRLRPGHRGVDRDGRRIARNPL